MQFLKKRIEGIKQAATDRVAKVLWAMAQTADSTRINALNRQWEQKFKAYRRQRDNDDADYHRRTDRLAGSITDLQIQTADKIAEIVALKAAIARLKEEALIDGELFDTYLAEAAAQLKESKEETQDVASLLNSLVGNSTYQARA